MSYLTEKKDHIIRKLPNLSPEEKEEIIRYFNIHPEAESEIDWNKSSSLTFKDFENIITKVSKTAKKKILKISGINGLTEDEDYIIVFEQEYEKENYTGVVVGYAPLNWEASKAIASPYVGTSQVTGKWCTAYQKNSEYWDEYCGKEGSIFIYFVDYRQYESEDHDKEDHDKSEWGKVAVRIFPEKKRGQYIIYQVWNSQDYQMESNEDNIYPDFLFDSLKMNTIIRKAIKLVDDAGGVIAKEEEPDYFSVYGFLDGEILDDENFLGEIRFALYNHHEDGMEVEDGGNGMTSSTVNIIKIGKGINSETSDLMTDLEGFNTENGIGLYIYYENDYTFRDAELRAERRWGQFDTEETDSTEFSRELESFLGKDTVDYIIFKNVDSDPLLEDKLDDNVNFLYWDTLEIEEKNKITYHIKYNPFYDFAPRNRDNWVSSPAQRRRDRQLDLPFGL